VDESRKIERRKQYFVILKNLETSRDNPEKTPSRLIPSRNRDFSIHPVPTATEDKMSIPPGSTDELEKLGQAN
jgi:hypothetical protein